ncbi:hypothetical protein CYMTET_34237 [Cymbomonas tetramitiformis]|uniref:Uncharacterized protein n=1 Tax=Cymbomonas tetramitiformis TaxID=36881 RepID=A0AAE0FBZ6_9CHLO|nr:hypothetical protein CYMTET_34237 [Cymbomonas tetramitiformis]
MSTAAKTDRPGRMGRVAGAACYRIRVKHPLLSRTRKSGCHQSSAICLASQTPSLRTSSAPHVSKAVRVQTLAHFAARVYSVFSHEMCVPVVVGTFLASSGQGVETWVTP